MQNTIWELPNQTNKKEIEHLALEMNASKTFIQLCFNRGLRTKEEIEHFIQPTAEWFNDPFTLFDMEKSIDRIQQAIASGQKITIYGDYDADGVTSTVIMYEAIDMLGGQVDYYIPNRFVEGYGPNSEAFEKIIASGTELIVTVDNGVAGHEAISYASNSGVDVIVTDHHECPAVLPDAYSIVHPRHPQGNYACPDLSGAGVSLKVATALLGEIPEELLDLAAIGTIADLVPLTEENRAIVYFGLKWMKQTQRIGLLALLSESSVPLESIEEETIGFKISPPINAVGRLGDATLVVDLLTSFDEEKARSLSQTILKKNEERKELVKQLTDEAFSKIDEESDNPIVVLYDKNWHEGVLGIVASKVTEKMNKPTIILTVDEETQKVKGSGRSIEGFNIYNCIDKVKDYLTHFGGHEMACGLSLERKALEPFIAALNAQAKEMLKDSDHYRKLTVDSVVEWDEITIDLIEELNQLRPFGQENRKPLLKIESVYPKNVKKIGADQTHLKLSLSKNEKIVDLIAFNSGHWEEVLSSSPEIDVLGYLDINEWNGNRKVQLNATDYKTIGSVIVDYRKKTEQKNVFDKPNAHYIFFHAKNVEKWKNKIHSESTLHLIGEGIALEGIKETEPIVVIDIPDTVEEFNRFYKQYQTNPFYLFFYAPNEYYFKGMPKREKFTTLYKWLLQKKEIDLKKDTRELKKIMKLDTDTVKFMLMVFLENEFVTIDSGKLKIVPQPQKKNLEDTLTYKKRLMQIRTEELLVYSSFNELLAYLERI